MPIEATPLLREIAGAVLKTTLAIVALVVVYPYVITVLGRMLSGH